MGMFLSKENFLGRTAVTCLAQTTKPPTISFSVHTAVINKVTKIPTARIIPKVLIDIGQWLPILASESTCQFVRWSYPVSTVIFI